MLRRCGDRAWLLDVVDDTADRVHARLVDAALPGVVALVPAATTVLVRFDPARTGAAALASRLHDLFDPSTVLGSAAPGGLTDPGKEQGVRRSVTIDVHYDGPDLTAVADLLGLSEQEVVDWHTAATWTSAFIGFAPGFAYLRTDDLSWRVPRRPTSRVEVPPGSVALADGWTGIYPRSSPGGWQLLGRTEATLWDPEARPPALLAPGTTVRFRAVDR